MKTYLFTTCLSFLFALAATPLTLLFAHRYGIVDTPNARSAHKYGIAHVGGIAIFVSVLLVVFPVLFLNNVIGDAFRGIQTKFFAVIFASSLMFVVGLADDLGTVRARYKLFAQLAASIIVCSFGIRIEAISVQGLFTINFGIYSWPLTILWLVGVTNAVNLIDGLDGLAAGICAIVCGFLAILAVHFGNSVMAILMLAMLGSLVGFLFFNFNPARIFMGDCGSLFLGFMIASSSVLTNTKSSALVGLALPVLALGIPIFDTLFTMLRRFIQRRSMFAPDKSHFHHMLLGHGLNHAHVAVVAYVVTIIVAGMGLFLMVTHSFASIIVFGCSLLLLVLVFRIVGSVRLRDTLAGIRSKHTISGQAKEETRSFEDAQLHFRNARTFDDWWNSVCLAAEKLDFSSVNTLLTNRDSTFKLIQWCSSGNTPASREMLKVDVPVRDRRAGPALNLKIEVFRDGSLESAGRKVALFIRLVDEKSLAALPAKGDDDMFDVGFVWV